jgi:hypothetical protein
MRGEVMRTTPEKVIDTLRPGRDWDEALPQELLTVPMQLAHKIVNRIQVSAADYDMDPLEDDGTDGSEAQLAETYLAAWAWCVSDQQTSSHSGKTGASFRGQSGMGFEMNNYGQAFLRLLAVAGLEALLTAADVGTEWLGTTKADERTWHERNYP